MNISFYKSLFLGFIFLVGCQEIRYLDPREKPNPKPPEDSGVIGEVLYIQNRAYQNGPYDLEDLPVEICFDANNKLGTGSIHNNPEISMKWFINKGAGYQEIQVSPENSLNGCYSFDLDKNGGSQIEQNIDIRIELKNLVENKKSVINYPFVIKNENQRATNQITIDSYLWQRQEIYVDKFVFRPEEYFVGFRDPQEIKTRISFTGQSIDPDDEVIESKFSLEKRMSDGSFSKEFVYIFNNQSLSEVNKSGYCQVDSVNKSKIDCYFSGSDESHEWRIRLSSRDQYNYVSEYGQYFVVSNESSDASSRPCLNSPKLLGSFNGFSWVDENSNGLREKGEHYFRVCSPNELKNVNETYFDWENKYSRANFILGKDIEMSSYYVDIDNNNIPDNQFAMCSRVNCWSFNGVFDGNSYSIRDFHYTRIGQHPDGKYRKVAIFPLLFDDPGPELGEFRDDFVEIRNLTIDRAYINGLNSEGVGILVGELGSSLSENPDSNYNAPRVDIKNILIRDSFVQGSESVGAVIGALYGSTDNYLSDIRVEGSQVVLNNVDSSESFVVASVGGITGKLENGKIERVAVVNTSVEVLNNQRFTNIGGLVGERYYKEESIVENNEASSQNSFIKDSFFDGTLSIEANTPGYSVNMGGIIGHVAGASFSLENSYSKGGVSQLVVSNSNGYTSAGGLAGGFGQAEIANSEYSIEGSFSLFDLNHPNLESTKSNTGSILGYYDQINSSLIVSGAYSVESLTELGLMCGDSQLAMLYPVCSQNVDVDLNLYPDFFFDSSTTGVVDSQIEQSPIFFWDLLGVWEERNLNTPELR